MFIGYVTVAVVAAAMNVWASSLDFRRAEQAVANADKVEVPPSWLLPLGALKFARAVGLIAGIALPSVGVFAAIGLAVVALVLRLASADGL
jgi:DoxX-like family